MHKGEEITIWGSREGEHVQNKFVFVSSSRQAVIWFDSRRCGGLHVRGRRLDEIMIDQILRSQQGSVI